jgi:hypothetical protein
MDYDEMMSKGRALLRTHRLHDRRFAVQNLSRKPGLTSPRKSCARNEFRV